MKRQRLTLTTPSRHDVSDLLELVRVSRSFHRPWVYPPDTRAAWARYLQRLQRGDVIGYLLRRGDSGAAVGVVNVNEVVRGALQSAYLGFYVHAAHARQGLMRDGLRSVFALVFGRHRLHRLEANIQPANRASVRLVESLGFAREGLSEKYLKVGGRWRDHERWAMTREVWRRSRGAGAA